jgi:hypothetical protein
LKSAKSPSDAAGGESAGFSLSFPGQAQVVDEAAGQVQLGVRGDDEPGPPDRLVRGWITLVWSKVFLMTSEGVLDVEAA